MIRISYKFKPEPIIGKDGKKHIPAAGYRIVNVVEPIKICNGVWTITREDGETDIVNAVDITGIKTI